MAANFPDLFLLSVFRKLNAEDRISACQVCTSWYHRVREVNQVVNFFTITVDCAETKTEYFVNHIDRLNFGYNPNMKQQLMQETAEEDREKLQCSANWNTLHFSKTSKLQLNSSTVQKIITAFPEITELNFINQSKKKDEYKSLVQMLEISEQNDPKNNSWGPQLTALRLFEIRGVSVSVETNENLFSAINRLPAIKRLVISKSESSLQLPLDLPVLARLKEVSFNQYKDEHMILFLQSVQKYAADNDQLRIDMPFGYRALCRYIMFPNNFTHATFTLDRHLIDRFARVSCYMYYYNDDATNFMKYCTSLPHLTSVLVNCQFIDDCATVFTIISQSLHHLRYLKLGVNFSCSNNKHEIENARSPTSPLPSVKALELHAILTSHEDVQWLNLHKTVPNVQAIHFDVYNCQKCDISTYNYDLFDGTTLTKQTFRKCFEAVLSQLSHTTAVPLEKITVSVKNIFTATAKQLLDH